MYAMRKFSILFVLMIFVINFSVSQSCLPEGIVLDNQEDIDNFQVNYPGCTGIDGSVIISSAAITNLNGLAVINHIGGFLEIEVSSLHDMAGLESLVAIGDDLIISGNDLLESLDGLENLTSIGDRLEINNNYSLTSLSGLSSLAFNSVKDLYLHDNLSLSTCNEQFICDFLANSPGSINIYNNSSGCNNPAVVAETCGDTISCLPFGNYYFLSQNEIDRFPSDFSGCTGLHGSVKISGTNIYNLNGLNGIHSIEGNLEIINNSVLSNLSGIENLGLIGGYVRLLGNAMLFSTDGVEGLDSIGNFLSISGNPVLEDLSGFSGLSYLGVALEIIDNDSLKHLDGLDYFDPDPVSAVVIFNNGLLSDCDIQSICDYLTNPEAFTNIYSNAAGCYNREEIQAACEVGLPDYQSTNYYSLFPDPVTSFATFQLDIEVPGHLQIAIFNSSGQEIEIVLDSYLKEGNHFVSWNAHNLAPGLYFYRISAIEDRQSIVGKFIKK
jgi:hypothetical protein